LTIKQNIIDFIKSLDENDSISFYNLEPKEQNYLRHALFISELDSKTFPLLNTRYKTFVNGTQGYFSEIFAFCKAVASTKDASTT
jgi:hypothetical protein